MDKTKKDTESEQVFTAKPVFNNVSKKWNVAMGLKGRTKIGTRDKESKLNVVKEFETKEKAIEYIHFDERLVLQDTFLNRFIKK